MTEASLLSRIVKSILSFTKPSYMNSDSIARDYLSNKNNTGFKSIFNTFKYEGMEVVSFGKCIKSSRVILYFHGGAYVNQMNYQHTLYCYLLSHLFDAYVLAPVYPLIPDSSYTDAYELIYKFYNHVVEKYDGEVIVWGDSAGGGFALSLRESLSEANVKLPEKLVVYSPWVDVSMSGDYDDSRDPILGVAGLKEFGKCWAGPLSPTDCRVSPLFCDSFPDIYTLIFVGSDEIFYDDVRMFYEKIRDMDVKCELFIGKSLFHIYPMFPVGEAVGVLRKLRKKLLT